MPYKGPLSETVFQLIGGLRSGMGYCGSRDIQTLRQTGEFIRITSAGLIESHPHDITITKEAPQLFPHVIARRTSGLRKPFPQGRAFPELFFCSKRNISNFTKRKYSKN